MNIHELLTYSLQQNASDLHINTGSMPMLRIDGEMQPMRFPILEEKTVQQWFYIVATTEQKAEFEEHKEVDFSFATQEGNRFRVNVFRQNRGLSMVLRAIPRTIPSLEQLQAPEILKSISDLQSGLVIVTGPTGSGKSTTLAAMVDYINESRRDHILTVEDPIEFIHQNKKCQVNQREVGLDTESFSRALRSALREDPDVILLGELRDLETIRLALTAAETGHLVFATLHTNSAAKTIHRLVDVFPGDEQNMVRGMLSESLQAVISQRLMRRNEKGRAAAYEVMMCTPAVRNLIRENKVAQIYSAIQTGATHGMQTLAQSVQKLIQLGVVDPVHASRFIESLSS